METGCTARLGLILLVLGIVFYSCEEIIEDVDISSQSIELLAPGEGTVVRAPSLGLYWNAIVDAQSYRIQVAEPNFAKAEQLWLDSVITVDSLGRVNTKILLELGNGTYQWRVKGMNSLSETPFTTHSFTVSQAGANGIGQTGLYQPTLCCPYPTYLPVPKNAMSPSLVLTYSNLQGTKNQTDNAIDAELPRKKSKPMNPNDSVPK